MLRFNLSLLAVAFLLLQNACDPKTGESDSATGSTSTSGESTTDASTTDDAPTSSATTGDSTSTDEEPTVATTGEDTESGTSGPVDPEHQSACESSCQQTAACEGAGEDEVAECVLNCTSEFQEIDAECVANHLAFLQCLPKLFCAPNEPVDESCMEAFEAHAICGNGAEECIHSMDEGGEGVCGLGLICPDLPTYEISCEGDTCVCLQDGVEVAQCPSDGVCAQGDAIFDKLDECCAGA
ncbi:hypothetical protein OV090_37620 [Nannocystis sp. RBIL2]|uniref:hypothetical protein n=1 Tax=Nannocystis sp. RBIL2 TaxID=2996788 RepID=UPI002271946A|nr:hypothetical protein [Nannocystis sp. RBIL2]MCY1070522.1 hypothetical protein [Nannocystis sp. RBIL2]